MTAAIALGVWLVIAAVALVLILVGFTLFSMVRTEVARVRRVHQVASYDNPSNRRLR